MWFESSVLAAIDKAGNQILTKTLVQTEGFYRLQLFSW